MRLLVIAAIAHGSVLGAQASKPLSFGRPTGQLPDEFTKVTTAAEVAPGRLAVYDEKERRLVILDFAAGTSRPVGRVGAGPGEFRSVGTLIARPGGGAYATDFILRRVLPILPDGKTAETIPFPQGSAIFESADSMGRLFGGIMLHGADRRLLDSMLIARWSPGSGRVDTLMQYDAGRSSMVSRRGEPRYVWRHVATWTALPNGNVALLESNGYRLSRWSDGRLLGTSSIPFPRVPITQAAKDAWMKDLLAHPPQMMGGGDGQRVAPAGAPAFLSGGAIFPETYPPFDSDADLRPAPDGTLWIERLRSPLDTIPLFDVLSPEGKRVAQVQLPPRSTLIALGRGAVYLVEKDDDDVSRVRRYAYPKIPK